MARPFFQLPTSMGLRCDWRFAVSSLCLQAMFLYFETESYRYSCIYGYSLGIKLILNSYTTIKTMASL